MAIKLRVLATIVLLGVTVFLGWQQKSPYFIPILAIIYTPAFFAGRMSQLRKFNVTVTPKLMLKSLPLTYLIQNLVAGVFFLSALGLGAAFKDTDVDWSIYKSDLLLVLFAFGVLSILNFLIYRAESPSVVKSVVDTEVGEGSINESLTDDEFTVVECNLNPENIFERDHFSRSNYTLTALLDQKDHKGDKPKRVPKAASESMIKETEDRIGFRLPETLRDIYKIQNGGSVDSYFVPIKQNPKAVYDDWMGAFAHDYDVINPLKDLASLYDSYMEYFDPEYSDPEEKNDWIKGSEKIIYFCSRTGYGSALDYRQEGEPGVLLFDHNNDVGNREVVRFATFDEFLGACRLHKFKDDGDEVDRREVFGEPPNPLDPDGFWGLSGNSSPKPVTEEKWNRRGEELGVHLPQELLPFYQVADGGTCIYKVAINESSNLNQAPLFIFPKGPYIEEGLFLGLDYWVSLSTLSDRLDFIDNRTPWKELFDEPEKLIVISAAFDSAIFLDYRKGNTPKVLCVKDLDKPKESITFSSVKEFLSRLRQYGIPSQEKVQRPGDLRISARKAHVESFWFENDHGSVSEDTYSRIVDKFGSETFGLPKTLESLYKQQNGGMVRYRWAPPQEKTATNYMRPDISSSEWQDVFPSGLMKMENWIDFNQWREENQKGKSQSLSEFVNNISCDDPDDEDVQIKLAVIGIHQSKEGLKLTLLDTSQDYFNRNRNIMTIQFDSEKDLFQVVWGPLHCDNVYHGPMESLRAHKSEL